ncbi:hypothetical protein TRAPUB_332 [Trametes pubescens]|uniref:Uncharacterized protein n=1 Tax=Trametes pubescens TaxID=154538 RepID=A0A1M2W7P9_TRAPU|nr:hypothetical protein TRAPUB_332 [Trametes pubescens]
MATVLMHNTYSPGPGRGILLNPSPGASPAIFPTSLPALVPSNSSLSSSASSSAPGEDYFSSKSSSSPSPGPSSSGSPAPRNSLHLHPQRKARHGSNPSTVRRIRFAPLPEPRRDLETADDTFPPVFVDDETDASHPHDLQPLTLSSALHAATLSLAAPGDSDLSRRTRSLPCSVTSSPTTAKKALPGDSLLLDPSCAQSSSASDPAGPTGHDAQHTTAASDLGQEWDVLPPSSPALPALSLSAAPDSPRKAGKWSKMLKPLLGRSSHGGHKSSLTRTTSVEEIAVMNGERGRGLLLGLSASRNSSRSRDASGSRERDQGRDRRDADFGLPLHRWTSEGQPVLPISKKKKHSLFGSSSGGGVPLGRTQSLTSLSSKDDRKALKPVIATNGGRKQQRMLNGRVYGAKRNNANPFANVRSEEPEFVEWGYGGMGSVKASAGQSQMWQKLQKGKVAIGGDENASWGARTSADEEDDGSGMTWLKKRREQREREKKEAEEQQKAEAETAKDTVESTEESAADASEAKPEGEVSASTGVEQKITAPTSENATITSTPASATPLASEPLHTPSHEEHITQTVNIPALHKRHHHSHSHSHSHGHHQHGHGHSLSLSLPHPERRESADTARGVPFLSMTPAASGTPTGQTEPVEDTEGTPIIAGARLRKESLNEGENNGSLSSSAASTTSTTSDDVDDSEDSPKDTEGGFGADDEEEDEEMLEEERKTALSAGVEKMVRHKEHDHAHEQANSSDEATGEAQASS